MNGSDDRTRGGSGGSWGGADHSRLESVLAEITSRFVNVRAGEVDAAIEEVQRCLCESLELDRSALFQYSKTDAGALLRTHVYQSPDLPLLSGEDAGPGTEVDARQHCPWIYEQIQRGEIVQMADIAALSAAAALDRENLVKHGVRSLVAVPLSAGGVKLGLLTFLSIRPRVWTGDLIKGFRTVANVFATWLEGKRAESMLQDKLEELEAAHAELQQSNNAVELERARYRELFESAPDAYLITDIQGVVLEANRAAESLFNCERTNLCGFPLATFVCSPDRAHFLSQLSALVARGGEPIAKWETRVQVRNRPLAVLNISVALRPDVIRGSTTLRWALRDITNQKAAQEALQKSEERFRQVAENVGDFIWEVNAEGLYTYTSPSVEGLFGYRPDELEGKMHFYDLFTPESREALKASAFNVFSQKKSFRAFPNSNVRKDGNIVHLETSGVPILDAAGNLLGYRGADTDVTARKLQEAALHRSWAEIQQLKDRLQAESEYLQTEIKVTESFGEIMGQSEAIKRVLHQIEQVAPANCPVLVQGETGTGKELIARAIHRVSPRGKRVMIKVNCAALPSALVESELFGRERGAFTGALTSQAGRFEVADGSTIFLDEVGELSLEIQAKLLRVLQEGEFERLGCPKVHKVDVRIIAASNRDLAEEVRSGRFRQDLFYRLSVFPIRVPALRERVEDIPALVFAFVTEFSSRLGKKITKLPRRTMDMLQRYSWPGNIRELRNVLEHAVILSTNEVLRIAPLSDAPQTTPAAKTLAESEREHILKVFEKTGGRVKGPKGAAEVLGINPGTLYSRMRKLGITKPRTRS